MDNMQDYRVADWKENGLIKRIKDTFSSVTVASIILGSALATGSAVASNLNPVASVPGVSSEAMSDLHAAVSSVPSMVHFRELGRLIEYGAANLDSPDTSDIDPEMLALADAAFEKIDARRAARN